MKTQAEQAIAQYNAIANPTENILVFLSEELRDDKGNIMFAELDYDTQLETYYFKDDSAVIVSVQDVNIVKAI